MAEIRVLVIDDNIDLTSIVSMILAAEGFSVKACNTLEEGCFYLKDWKPQVLLLDVNIDGEDGRLLCQKIKADKKESTYVILMSGDELTLEATSTYSADDVIAKPFESTELLQKISVYRPTILIPDT
jgi:DNA-binding response OmpR family regulator